MLDKACPYYMAIGVSFDEFWNGDYTRLKYYVDANLKIVERKNQELWLQGMYNYEAVSIAMANAFRAKGKPTDTYPDQPHRITPLSEEEEEEQKKRQVEEFRAKLLAFGKRCEERHKRDSQQEVKQLNGS